MNKTAAAGMSFDLLLLGVSWEGKICNVGIREGRFSDLNAPQHAPARQIIEAQGFILVPAFYNTHTHAAMTLLRGYADDLELWTWLTKYVWPREAKLTAKDIYEGSRLAILEMIKSGTVFFNDMYFEEDETAQAAADMGVRAAVGSTFADRMGDKAIAAAIEKISSWKSPAPGRVMMTSAPHAPYTCGPELLRRTWEAAIENHVPYHIHVAETKKEVDDCFKQYGMTPVRWLDHLGVLGPQTIAAHVVWVDDEEIEILKKRQVVISHNPCSNMKLSSGIFRSKDLQHAGCRITLGTDGTASNNNLDLREEMKFAALLAKVRYDSQTLPAKEVMRWATRNGAQAFGLDAGEIRQGALADCLLLNPENERMVPAHNLISDWVYAADSACIDTVICAGRVLMRHRYIPGEEEIIARARQVARDLVQR